MDLKQKYGKVAVLMGGDSSEREISLISGNAVLASLIKSGVDAHAFDPSTRPLQDLCANGFVRVVLMTHGPRGEDGTLQGALEYLKIPYSGSGVMASAIAMDKYRTKLIWQGLGIPVARSQYINKKARTSFKLELSLPVVVKPVNGGSTIGLTFVTKMEQLSDAINLAFTYSEAVLVEKMIIGPEYTITISDGVVYPIIQIVAPQGNYDYQNKYFTDVTKYICPIDLGELQAVVEDYAIKAYDAIGARGVARLDFMINEKNEVFFLEINTLPGMTSHSLAPMAYNDKGINFDALCLEILNGARLGN
jgi:D-alanine-D-alanine ligase